MSRVFLSQTTVVVVVISLQKQIWTLHLGSLTVIKNCFLLQTPQSTGHPTGCLLVKRWLRPLRHHSARCAVSFARKWADEFFTLACTGALSLSLRFRTFRWTASPTTWRPRRNCCSGPRGWWRDTRACAATTSSAAGGMGSFSTPSYTNTGERRQQARLQQSCQRLFIFFREQKKSVWHSLLCFKRGTSGIKYCFAAKCFTIQSQRQKIKWIDGFALAGLFLHHVIIGCLFGPILPTKRIQTKNKRFLSNCKRSKQRRQKTSVITCSGIHLAFLWSFARLENI